VERALTLVATGTLTIDMVRAAKGKTVSLPKTFNLSTGKDSMCQTGFSDVAWGKVTRGYAKSARGLKKVKFDTVVEEAQEFIKPTRGCGKSTQLTEVIDVDEDERACLVDNSDSESEECKSAFPSVSTELKLSFRICIMVSSPCIYINPHSVLISLRVLA
jgi:hypothetical protein